MDTIILLLGSGFIGTITGYFIKHKLNQKTELNRRLRESKEKQYLDLLTYMLSFFEGWEDKEGKQNFLREVYKKAPLYASDEVLKLSYKFIESHSDTQKNKESDKIYAETVLVIRKELNDIFGEPKTSLTKKDIKVMKIDR